MTKITKEQKDRILTQMAAERNGYVRECRERIGEENGKIAGADYMLERFLDLLCTEVASEVEPPTESEEQNVGSD